MPAFNKMCILRISKHWCSFGLPSTRCCHVHQRFFMLLGHCLAKGWRLASWLQVSSLFIYLFFTLLLHFSPPPCPPASAFDWPVLPADLLLGKVRLRTTRSAKHLSLLRADVAGSPCKGPGSLCLPIWVTSVVWCQGLWLSWDGGESHSGTPASGAVAAPLPHPCPEMIFFCHPQACVLMFWNSTIFP